MMQLLRATLALGLLVAHLASPAAAEDSTTAAPTVDGLDLPSLQTAEFSNLGSLIFTDPAVTAEGVPPNALLVEDAGALQTLKEQLESVSAGLLLDLDVAKAAAQEDEQPASRRDFLAAAVNTLTAVGDSVANELNNVAHVAMILRATTAPPRNSPTQLRSTSSSPSSTRTTATAAGTSPLKMAPLTTAGTNAGANDCASINCQCPPGMHSDPHGGCCACKAGGKGDASTGGISPATQAIIIVLVVLLVVVGGLFAFCCIRRTVDHDTHQPPVDGGAKQPNAVYNPGENGSGGGGGARPPSSPVVASSPLPQGAVASPGVLRAPQSATKKSERPTSLVSAGSSRRGSDNSLLDQRQTEV